MFLSSCQIGNFDVAIGGVYDPEEMNNGYSDQFRQPLFFLNTIYPDLLSGFCYVFIGRSLIQPFFLYGLHPFIEAGDKDCRKDRIDSHTEYNGGTE